MKVKCIANNLQGLNSNIEKRLYNSYIHQSEVDIEIGVIYQVFGIGFLDDCSNIPWYLIRENVGDEFPVLHLGSFFKISDSKIPENWEFVSKKTNIGNCALLPKIWAQDSCFLEKLINRDSSAIGYFNNLIE